MKKFKEEVRLDNYDNYTRKLMKSIRNYFMHQYKQIIFDILPNIKKDGSYHFKLNVDKKVESVYGSFEFDLLQRNGIRTIENVTYEDLLYEGYTKALPTHNGVIYRNKRDLMKIKMYEAIKEE